MELTSEVTLYWLKSLILPNTKTMPWTMAQPPGPQQIKRWMGTEGRFYLDQSCHHQGEEMGWNIEAAKK